MLLESLLVAGFSQKHDLALVPHIRPSLGKLMQPQSIGMQHNPRRVGTRVRRDDVVIDFHHSGVAGAF